MNGLRERALERRRQRCWLGATGLRGRRLLRRLTTARTPKHATHDDQSSGHRGTLTRPVLGSREARVSATSTMRWPSFLELFTTPNTAPDVSAGVASVIAGHAFRRNITLVSGGRSHTSQTLVFGSDVQPSLITNKRHVACLALCQFDTTCQLGTTHSRQMSFPAPDTSNTFFVHHACMFTN